MTPSATRFEHLSRQILTTIASGLTVTLGLCACTFSAPPDPLDAGIPAGDDTPFEQHQSLEDYAATVPPAIIELQEQLTRSGSGDWKRSQTRHQFIVDYCVEPDKKRGNRVTTFGGDAASVSVEKVVETGNNILAPLGYTMTSQKIEEGTSLMWIDWHNGGHVEVFVGKSKISIFGDSDCRPSTDPERIRLELQALAPLPSEIPTETTPSLSTPTRSISTRHTSTGKRPSMKASTAANDTAFLAPHASFHRHHPLASPIHPPLHE